MELKHVICVSILPLVAWSATASAQTEKPKPKPPAQEQPKAQEQPRAKATATAVVPFCHKASEIVGAKVKNPKGEDLGKIEELVLDPGSGSIEYAVLSFGGFMGMGDKLFAMPFSVLRAPEVAEGSPMAHFTLDLDKTMLEKAPGFPKNNWPDIHTPEWRSGIDKFFGVTPRNPGDALDENRQLRLCKASELMGKKVENATNDNLGDIKELVLDPRAARVSYFVLTSGGFLGMGNKLVAIPWEALSIRKDGDKDKYVLQISKEQIQSAPEYKEADWKRMSDPEWVRELYKYYDFNPYWTDAGYPKTSKDM